MFKRDYFMRQIEQLTVVLHRILFHRQKHQFEEAQRLLEEACRHLLGLNLKNLELLSTRDILSLLQINGYTDTGKALVLADLIKEDGDLQADRDDMSEAYLYRLKALDLLLELSRMPKEEGPNVEADIKPRLLDALQRLDKLQIPLDMRRKLFGFYAETGAYAKAEDVLFHLLEDLSGEREAYRPKGGDLSNHRIYRDLILQGIAFYDKLQFLDEEALAAGNLSKTEVSETLEQLLLMEVRLRESGEAARLALLNDEKGIRS